MNNEIPASALAAFEKRGPVSALFARHIRESGEFQIVEDVVKK